MDLDNLVKQLRSFFEQEKDISVVYLFGSQAKNKARAGSDVDVAILFNKDISSEARFYRRLELMGDLQDFLHCEVDVLDLESADQHLVHQAMLSKIIIADNNTDRRVRFEVTRRNIYSDFQFYSEIYKKEALKRLERR